MRSFYYQRGRSAVAALFLAFVAICAGRTWRSDGGFLMLSFALLATLGAAKASLDATNKQPALKFDGHSIWVRRTWGGLQEISWREVHDISAKAFTVRYLGIIPVRRQIYFSITSEGGTFGARRFRVSASAMGMSTAEAGETLAVLKRAHVQAVGEVGAAMAAAGSRGWGVDMVPRDREQGFDADAALARYLAARDDEKAAAAPVAATTRPIVPQRPAFGRRVS